ncbi:MAG: nucleotide exchange factor GrpE [Epulopiscium sp.]|nr:nucleotide exchange factor GrpE [Candidatus Epulonipiscium sp.]
MDDIKKDFHPEQEVDTDTKTTEEIIEETPTEESCDVAPDTDTAPEEPAVDEKDALIAKLEQQSADYLDKYQRCLAEFDNFRKRTSKEKASMYDDGIRSAVEKLLPVIDNFERALSAPGEINTEEDSFYKGIQMIMKQLQEILVSMGVEEIKALGEKFDPNLHAAVAHEDNDAYSENEVIEELRKGYKYKDKVIRHSMVKVAN